MRKEKFKLTKDSLTRVCAAAGLLPEVRTEHRGYDIFVGHGFTGKPGVTLKRFGVDHSMFPFGCFLTLWSVAKGEDCILIAAVEPYIDAREKNARLQMAIDGATAFIDKLKKVANQGVRLNA